MYNYKEDILIENRSVLPGLIEVLKTIQAEDFIELSRMLEMYGEYKLYDKKTRYTNNVVEMVTQDPDFYSDVEEGVDYIVTRLSDGKWQVEKTGTKLLVTPEIPVTASKRELIDVFVFICKNKPDERYGDDDYWLEVGGRISEEIRPFFRNNKELQDKNIYIHNTHFSLYRKFIHILKYPEEYDCFKNNDGTYAVRFLKIPLPGLDHIDSEPIARDLLADIYRVQFGRTG